MKICPTPFWSTGVHIEVDDAPKNGGPPNLDITTEIIARSRVLSFGWQYISRQGPQYISTSEVVSWSQQHFLQEMATPAIEKNMFGIVMMRVAAHGLSPRKTVLENYLLPACAPRVVTIG